jgi:ABC-type multidrug transport system ATPase subunit
VLITLSDIGKKFNRQWVFKGINLEISSQQSLALVGNNGSGKSTLIQIIFNFQTYSKGSINYWLNQKLLTEEELVGKISLAAPYLELFEDFTLIEMLQFHFKLIPKQADISLEEMISNGGLGGQENKAVKYFSSGMKQRLKLLMAVYADTPLLLLDEPCSNLDNQGIEWYRNLVQTQLKKRTIIIASNQLFEYDFCDSTLSVHDFKP